MNLEKGDYFTVKRGPAIPQQESIFGTVIATTMPQYDMRYANHIFKVLEVNGDFVACERVYPVTQIPAKGFLDTSELDIWPISKEFVEALK